MSFTAPKLSPKEKRQILVEWNNTSSDYPKHMTITELFEEQVKKHPKAVALTFKTQSLDYERLNEKANQLAHYLKPLGLNHQSVAAICLKPSFELLISIFAVLKAGASYVPLDHHNPAKRQEFFIKDTQAKIIITESDFSHQFIHTFSHVINLDLDQKLIHQFSKENPVSETISEDIAYIIYTSGSTGKPKGVLITHRNIHNFCHWFQQALNVNHQDIFDFSCSIAFDFSVAVTLFPLIIGAKIAICPKDNKRDFNLYLQHLLNTQVSIIKITPSYFRQFKEFLLTQPVALLLKYVIFGGEKLFASDLKDWLTEYPRQIMFCEYGPTETTVAASWIKINHSNIHQFEHTIPLGKPALNTQLYILDKNQRPAAIGEIGELYIGGDGVAQGYLNQKKLTDNAFIPNKFKEDSNGRIYKTGDRCRYLPGGNIEFIERVDYQVKINGFRIEINEIENYLNAYPDIKQAIVLPYELKKNQSQAKQLITYYVASNRKKIKIHKLRSYLQEYLPEYMVPNFYISMDSLPLSTNGKLDRNKLPMPENLFQSQGLLPRNALEITLRNIWANTLNLEKISIEDNFFDLGGNSLLAARIITKIRKILKKDIQLRDIYTAPTILDLTKVLYHTQDLAFDKRMNVSHGHPNEENMPLNELQFLFWVMMLCYPRSKVLNITTRLRIKGKIDKDALNYAYQMVQKTHVILRCHISKFYPIHKFQRLYKNSISIKDIQHLIPKHQETQLLNSLQDLEHMSWKKKASLYIVRLFYLAHNYSEVQIGISHLVSDEISKEVIISDLSYYYCVYKEGLNLNVEPEKFSYKNYIVQEQENLRRNLPAYIQFWKNYLKTSSLLYFPSEKRIKNKDNNHTSYFEIPGIVIKKLDEFCQTHRISITDSLCAAVGQALKKYCANNKKNVVLNLVKSIRYQKEYDKTVGLFVRTDLVKLDLSQTSNLLKLAKQVQKELIETASWQFCPTVIKLAYLLQGHWKNKKFSEFFIKSLAKFISFLFPKAKLDYRILMMFGRLYLARKKHHYYINLNITNRFIHNRSHKNLFGCPVTKNQPYEQDKMCVAHVINIWFDKNHIQKPCLVISADLTTELRYLLAQEIIKKISLKE